MSDWLSLSSTVKIPDGIVHRDLQGELVLLSLDSGIYFGLDLLGTRIWHLLQAGRTLQQVLDAVLQEYDVPEAQCRQDLLNLVTHMREKGLIEVCNGSAS